MTPRRTFGRYPTLGEMKWYYNRDDVLTGLFDACRRCPVTAALRGAHWEIRPTSKQHLRQIINETIKTQIEPIFDEDSDRLSELTPRVEVVADLGTPDALPEAPRRYLVLWHGTTMNCVQEILDNGFKTLAGARGVWFSPSFGFSRQIAESRANERDAMPAVLRCLFDARQERYLAQTGPAEYVFYPAILSFHARTEQDIVFESDVGGWRRSFGTLLGAIEALDDFQVVYRLKYSGNRSLHLMIPADALPEAFEGKPLLAQMGKVYRRIRGYFQQHCSMGKVDLPKVLRLAYSLNEDNGLVSLPVHRANLADFSPWHANMHLVTVGNSWYGDVPADARERTLRFFEAIYDENVGEQATRRPVQRNVYTPRSALREPITPLNSGEQNDRVSAAWQLMIAKESVPIKTVQQGLTDANADVRWFLTESLKKNISPETVRLATQMLFDGDSLVGHSAIGALMHAGHTGPHDVLNPFWEIATDFLSTLHGWRFYDFMWTIETICLASGEPVVESFLASGIRKVALAAQQILEKAQIDTNELNNYLKFLGHFSEARTDYNEHPTFAQMRQSLIEKILRDSEAQNSDSLFISILRDPLRILCNYLLSQSKINTNTVAAVRTLDHVNRGRLRRLPARIPANSLQEWFKKAWIVCGSALLSSREWRSNAIEVFHNAYRRVKRFDASEVEKASVIGQLERLFQLSNPYQSLNAKVEAALFRASDELVELGHDLRYIVIGLLSGGNTHQINGAIRLIAHLCWKDSANLLISQFARSKSPRATALRSIIELGESVVEPLIDAVRTQPHRRVVELSIEALRQIGDERAIPVLQTCTVHKNKNIRLAAIRALRTGFGIGAVK